MAARVYCLQSIYRGFCLVVTHCYIRLTVLQYIRTYRFVPKVVHFPSLPCMSSLFVSMRYSSCILSFKLYYIIEGVYSDVEMADPRGIWWIRPSSITIPISLVSPHKLPCIFRLVNPWDNHSSLSTYLSFFFHFG